MNKFGGQTFIISYVAVYSEGINYARKKLDDIFERKRINVKWCYHKLFDNLRINNSKIEFLWPRNNKLCHEAIDWCDNLIKVCRSKSLGTSNIFRQDNCLPTNDFFSTPQIRDLVESKFLEEGIKIINANECPEFVRPLGFDKLHTLGHGSLFTSYRNVPTNSPIVFWFDGEKHSYPWKPLLKRKSDNPNIWWF